MKQKGFIITLLFLSACFKSYSQNDWRQGFIIENSGDTIFGLIDYRSARDNSQICYFKERGQKEFNKFSPQQIKGYRFIDSKYYISKPIYINGIEKIVFLEFLINGIANVYYFKGFDEKYYLEKDNELYELKDSEEIVIWDNKKYEQKKQEYIGTMRYLFQDAHIQNDINNTKLDHKSLIKVTKKYHNKVCIDEECVIYEKNIKTIKVDFGLVYGMNSNTLYLESHYASSGFTYSSHQDFCNYAGITMNFKNLPGINERLSLQTEFLVYKYYLDYPNSIYYEAEDYKKYLLNIPLLLDYRLLTTKIYPKIEIGTSMIFVRNDRIKSQNMTLTAGLSLHYEYLKDHRIFINTRFENRPRMVRFGGGLIF